MERKHGVTMHWGILLIVYLAILFATAMVVLTSDAFSGLFVLLLAVGVPIYLISSRAIMSGQESSNARSQLELVSEPLSDPSLILFPERGDAEATAELLQAAGARTPRIRKLR